MCEYTIALQQEEKCEEKKTLSIADRSLTGEEEAQLRRMDDYDVQEELKFCEVDGMYFEC